MRKLTHTHTPEETQVPLPSKHKSQSYNGRTNHTEQVRAPLIKLCGKARSFHLPGRIGSRKHQADGILRAQV